MAVQRPERVRQDRTGHVEDHVAERGPGFQRVAPVQSRDVLRQADPGSPPDQGGACLRQVVPCRGDRPASVINVGNRGCRLFIGVLLSAPAQGRL